ncbi:hypothetical protein GQ54DRAFT_264416, partial [Martensiomyces pterosporus]
SRSTSTMEQAKRLLKQKDDLESEIRDLESQLRAQGVNRTEKLVDQDGFPRADIDIVAIREIRKSLIYKQNDLKALMREVELSLISLHRDTSSSDKQEPETPAHKRPFARINSVAPNSPASAAGLAAGDKVLSFGSVNASNHSNLQRLAAETASNEDKQISVQVERVVNAQPQIVSISLVPKRGWGGNGLLGCHILPL